MTIEDPKVLKEKNRRCLRDVINVTFAVGINVTAPSKKKSYLRIIPAVLLVGSLGCAYGNFAFIYRHRNSIVIMAESICTGLQTLLSTFKLSYIVFVQHRFYRVLSIVKTHELVDTIDFLTNETPFNKKLRQDTVNILNQCWKMAKGQFYFYLVACCLIISYYFFGAIAINTYNAIIGTANYTNVLAYPSLYPFWEHKMNKFPYYHILTCVGGSGVYIAGICAVSFDGMFIIFALHAVALLRILKKMIVFTTSPNVPKVFRLVYLRQCIGHYERTYQYCKDLNNLYWHLSLVQFLMSLFILGVVMFQGAFGLENDFMMLFKMVLFISASGFEVVIYCLNGQLITSESETLPFAWYECEWYNESKEFKQLIYMMILRSNRVIRMKASEFTTMSLTTLLTIFKTSSSYFLLLRNLST